MRNEALDRFRDFVWISFREEVREIRNKKTVTDKSKKADTKKIANFLNTSEDQRRSLRYNPKAKKGKCPTS
jgi:hypothetical protein